MNRKIKSRLINFFERMRLRLLDKAGYLILVISLVAVYFLGSASTFFFERSVNPSINTFGDALWLSIVTMATVGYGDTVPITRGGRISCVLVIIFGIGLLSVFISTRASKQVEKTRRRFGGLEKSIRTRDHILICGWNSRGPVTIANLKVKAEKEKTPIILMCDLNENPIDDEYVYFLKGSAVNEKDLRRANAADARSVILLADDQSGSHKGGIDAMTILAALTVKALNSSVQITAEVLESENVEHLKRAGVTEILEANTLLGNLIARSAYHHGLISVISDLVASSMGSEVMNIPVKEEMAGKEYKELYEMCKAKGLQLVGIRTENDLIKEDIDYRVKPSDRLIVMRNVDE